MEAGERELMKHSAWKGCQAPGNHLVLPSLLGVAPPVGKMQGFGGGEDVMWVLWHAAALVGHTGLFCSRSDTEPAQSCLHGQGWP